MTPDLIAWLSTPEDVEQRRARIAGYLANEGYELPPPPRNADYDESSATHWIRDQEMTVAYSVEWEVDHIMLRCIRRGEEWMLEHLDLIPSTLRRGRIVVWEIGHIIYESPRRFLSPENGTYRLRVVIQQRTDGRWWVSSFHPRPSR